MSKKTETASQTNNGKKIKKIALTVVLLIIVGTLAYVVLAKPEVEKNNTKTTEFVQVKDKLENDAEEVIDDEEIEEIEGDEIAVSDEDENNEEDIMENMNLTENKDCTVTKFKDGTLYAISGESIKPELIIGNNYFDTQLQDVSLNFSKYDGKTVEIEGFFIENTPFTFVGRYSESNLCPTCPAGYSYFEYEWHGKEKLNFTNEKEWLKVVGTFRKGEDETGEYYYIDASSIKVMKEWGQDTVKN